MGAATLVWSLVTRLRSLVSSFACWLLLCWRVSRLPGPPAEILRGHSRVIEDNSLLRVATKWERVYPHCHKFFLAMYPVILVYSPEAVQAVLSKKQKHNDKGHVYHALAPLLGDGLISSKGDKWFSHRKMLTPAFHFQILENFFEIFKAQTSSYLAELQLSPLLSDYQDVCPYTKNLTLKIICETAMGVCLEPGDGRKKEDDEILRSMHRLEKIGTVRMIKPWLLIDEIFRKTKRYREQEKYRKVLHSFTNMLIQKRREDLVERPSDGDMSHKKREIFLDLLILQQLKYGALTDDEIRDEVNTFMFAGHNTTQLAINYSIYLLGRYKDCQELAIREQDEIFGDSDREPTLTDLGRMEYLDRCLKETLRLYPSVPILARRLTEDQPIGDYTLPKGADCILLPYVTHRIPEQFPNPEEFNPDNFLPERVSKRHAYSYFPFSAGPRNCIGKKFASIAAKTVLSGVLRKFRIESLQKQEDLNLLPITILVPTNGLKVKLTPR